MGTLRKQPGTLLGPDTAILTQLDGTVLKVSGEIGNALQKAYIEGIVKREDMFITTKVSAVESDAKISHKQQPVQARGLHRRKKRRSPRAWTMCTCAKPCLGVKYGNTSAMI